MHDKFSGRKQSLLQIKEFEFRAAQAVSYLLVLHAPWLLNSTKLIPEEHLPSANLLFTQLCWFFFSTTGHRVIQVDQAIVVQEAKYFQTYSTLAYFIKGRPSKDKMRHWILLVQNVVKVGITINRNLEKGFLL